MGEPQIRQPTVTVLHHRAIPAGTAIGADVMPLGVALRAVYEADSHFQAGTVATFARFTKATPGAVTMTAAVFDVDGPGHIASSEWRAGESRKLSRLLAERPGLFVYQTRHGYRIVGVLGDTIEISSAEDAAAWKARYLGAVELLAERFGIAADRSCADHTRLFRLPHVVRDAGGKAERLPTIGDPEAIGVFELPKAAKPQAAEISLNSLSCPAGAARAQTRVALAPSSRPPAERGTLYDLLEERGDVLRPHTPGIWVVRCPRDHEHSTGAAGDTSTLFYEANTLGGSGAIFCQHESCRGFRTTRQWKRAVRDLEVAGSRALDVTC
jgi:hypothetical protein